MPRGNPGKERTQTEARLCAEYVAQNYPTSRVLLQQYVGPIHPVGEKPALSAEEERAIGTGRRRADAVIILPDELHLLECYIHVNLGKLSQLMTYTQLLPLTPELENYTHLPIKGFLVGAQRDPILDQMAARFNIEVKIFRPQWVVDYFANFPARKLRDRRNANLGVSA